MRGCSESVQRLSTLSRGQRGQWGGEYGECGGAGGGGGDRFAPGRTCASACAARAASSPVSAGSAGTRARPPPRPWPPRSLLASRASATEPLSTPQRASTQQVSWSAAWVKEQRTPLDQITSGGSVATTGEGEAGGDGVATTGGGSVATTGGGNGGDDDVAGTPLRKKRRRGAPQHRDLAQRQRRRREAGEGLAR